MTMCGEMVSVGDFSLDFRVSEMSRFVIFVAHMVILYCHVDGDRHPDEVSVSSRPIYAFHDGGEEQRPPSSTDQRPMASRSPSWGFLGGEADDRWRRGHFLNSKYRPFSLKTAGFSKKAFIFFCRRVLLKMREKVLNLNKF